MKFTVIITNTKPGSQSRTVVTEALDPMLAHKAVYLKDVKQYEEIEKVIDEKSGACVFDLKTGFNLVSK